MPKKEPIFVTTTTYRDVEFEVGFVERNQDLLQGYIKGAKKVIRFTWRPGVFKERPAIYGANYKDPNVVEWVVGILDATAESVISDNHPGGGGRTLDNVSRLIKDGHYRKACRVHLSGDREIIRRACVVNPLNTTKERLKELEEYVALMNVLVKQKGRPISHKEMRELF